MNELLKDIVSYLSYLENSIKLNISVHFANDVLGSIPGDMFEKLLPYNVHKNYFCSVVKRTNRDSCIRHQQELLRCCNSEASFCNACHAGVEEYIQQIKSEDKILGYISISGYRANKVPVECIDMEAWEKCLQEDPVPTQMLDTLVSPLRRMLQQFLVFPVKNREQSEYNLILQYLHECAGQVTLEDICNHFGRSKSYVSHLFNKNAEMSLPAYCNMLKLNHAKHLLSGGNTSVTEIAYDAGFQDVSYFIRQFKQAFHITPLQYQKTRDR